MDATFVMNFLAPLLLGIAIGALVFRTRRTDWNQRARTERQTEAVYDRAEDERVAVEERDEKGAASRHQERA